MVGKETFVSPEVITFKNVALTFPGQGSQSAGMGRDLFEGSPAARLVFEEADNVLSMKFSELMFEGSDDELRPTINAQPAIFIHSVAALRALEERIGKKVKQAQFVAGHSIGEYAALVASNALSFPDGLKLVRERGRLMQDAKEGSMAAVLGSNMSNVELICQKTRTVIANDNCEGQLVISGDKASVADAIRILNAQGVKGVRIIQLNVSGAFHSPLMMQAAEGMGKVLSLTRFQDPEIPIISNVTTEPIKKAEELPGELKRQLYSRVRWLQSVKYMLNHGTEVLLEIGPGQVLTGLVKRIKGPEDKVEAISLGNLEVINNFVT